MGQPIINHQAVAFMLADMAIGVEAARGLVWQAAWAQPPFDWQMLSPWMPYTLTSVSFSSDLILLFR
jgi:alkylation response protein AidB-like acyl-CoA dehydrogenase